MRRNDLSAYFSSRTAIGRVLFADLMQGPGPVPAYPPVAFSGKRAGTELRPSEPRPQNQNSGW